MICPSCERLMESMGYGDCICETCNIVVYSKTDEEFYSKFPSEAWRELQDEDRIEMRGLSEGDTP